MGLLDFMKTLLLLRKKMPILPSAGEERCVEVIAKNWKRVLQGSPQYQHRIFSKILILLGAMF